MAEREILQNAILVPLMHHRGGAEIATALGAFALEQMALAGVRAQNLAFGGDFEPLGNGFFGFDTFWSSHKIELSF